MVELFWVLDSIVVALLYHMPHQTHAGALQRLLVPRRSLPLKQITAPLIYHWAMWVKRETVKQIITHRSLKLISMRTLHSEGLPLFFFFPVLKAQAKINDVVYLTWILFWITYPVRTLPPMSISTLWQVCHVVHCWCHQCLVIYIVTIFTDCAAFSAMTYTAFSAV